MNESRAAKLEEETVSDFLWILIQMMRLSATRNQLDYQKLVPSEQTWDRFVCWASLVWTKSKLDMIYHSIRAIRTNLIHPIDDPSINVGYAEQSVTKTMRPAKNRVSPAALLPITLTCSARG